MSSISKISFGNYQADMLAANNVKLERLASSINAKTATEEKNGAHLAKLVEINAQILATQNRILQKLK